MAKNDLVLLDGIIDNYISRGLPSDKVDEAFEYFATEQILKKYALSKQQIMSGSVDGRNDGGIDEFFVLVNGHLAEMIPDEFWPKSNAVLDLYIITCKHDDSFKQAPITTMIPSLMELFDFSISRNELEDSYNEQLLNKREVLAFSYRKLAACLTEFNIYVIYACRGNEEIETNIQTKAEQVEVICREAFDNCNANFEFWGNSKLLASQRCMPKTTLALKFSESLSQNGQYVLLSKLEDYYAFLKDENGNLNRYLFNANVRDYLGLNPVNQDIADSLNNKDDVDFWWLNNGITLIGSQAHIVGNEISLSDIQIVNGLQTSETIFKHFSAMDEIKDERNVLIKVILTTQKNTCDSIIYATNNQTNVTVSALHANDKIQNDIDDILKLHEVYYERKPQFYQNRGIPQQQIITPLALAAGFVCLIHKNVTKARSLKQKFMRDAHKYNAIFSEDVDINVWYPIAVISMRTESALNGLRSEFRGSPSKFMKKYKYIVMFLTTSRLLGTYAFEDKKLSQLDISQYTEQEVEITFNDIIGWNTNMKRTPFTEPELELFYNQAEQKYNIDARKSIPAIAKKYKKLMKEEIAVPISITSEIVEKVASKLSPQPWNCNEHIRVATELNVSARIVKQSISYLIYEKRINEQVYGYVFDSCGRIIAEGKHLGHSESEAREMLRLRGEEREKEFKDFVIS